MSDNPQRLASIVVQIGEAVVATTDTVEKLAIQVQAIANQLQQQEHQVQQQSYQLFALSEILQTVIDSQLSSQQQISQLNHNLEQLIAKLESRYPQP
jgi:ABC-type transporter Mla subunit MlaD